MADWRTSNCRTSPDYLKPLVKSDAVKTHPLLTPAPSAGPE